MAVPAPPPPRPAPIRPLRATWTFEAGDGSVHRHRGGRRHLAAGDGPPRRADPAHRGTGIRSWRGIRGRSHLPALPGRWQAQTRRAGARQVAVSLGADNTALSHVLMLLSGGTLDFGPPDRAIASLTIPPSDTGGQNWFDCAREKMF